MGEGARSAALRTLERLEQQEHHADTLIDRELSSGTLNGPDRGLFTELVYGTLRRQGTLDHVMDHLAQGRQLENSVRRLLRLGLYQLLFLDRVPPRAAVHETVELAKGIVPRAAGFINAILREADRQREAIPYPDPQRLPIPYLARRYSHPEWLVTQWLEKLGFAEAEALSAAMAEPAPVTIRANTLKISRDQLMDRLIAEGVIASPCHYSPFGINLASSPLPPYQLSPFRDGFMTVQDESSQLATMLLSPQAGERILDLCAAPGGKATLLAQLMNNQGEVVAADKGDRKLPLITQNANRLGVNIITLLRHDATQPLSPEVAKGGFQRVLIDPPCSGLGVIRRHPEAKWRTTPADFERLPLLQQTILEQGARYLKPGGTLLYATCTTTNQENEGVVDDFLSRHPEFVVEELQTLFPHLRDLITDRGFFRSWPHRHAMDGFFAARLRRR